MKKRLLAFLLAAAIMLSDVAPVVTAFAEDVRQEPAVEQPLAPEQPETPADTPEVPRETEVPAEEAETPAETPRAEEETPAETPAPVEQPEDPAAETPATDTPAADQPAVEEPADTPVTEEPADTPVVDEPVTDETITEEPVVDETLTEEPVTEETEPEEKSVFPGMPEGYKLTATQAKFKAELQAAETKAAYTDLKAGDYVPGRVMFMADSEEEALLVAEGYGAELISYAYGVAVIRLPEEATVQMALETAWADNNLPAVYPDLIYKSGPVDMKKPDGEMLGTQMVDYGLLRETDWFNWGYGDPLLSPEDVDYFWHLQEIGVYQAWGTTQGSDDITVAVIDSGLDSCPDLGANIVGISSGELGASFDIMAGNSHGTHVTGIIGATYGNDRDGAGVAPETSVVSLCVLDADDDGTWYMEGALIVAAINMAAENAEDCNIINMSLGGYIKDYMMEYAINNAVNKGIVVIAAAGNDGTNIKCYPAAYDNVISVAATDQSGNRAFFSNYGKWVDISAPGIYIPSTVGTGIEYMSGTSQAAPIVSGVAALYMSVKGNGSGDVNGDGVQNKLDVDAVKDALIKTSRKAATKDIPGIVDAAKLMESVIAKPLLYGEIYDWREGEVIATTTDFSSAVLLNSYSELFLCPYMEESVAANDYTIVYTLDGKAPKVKDGRVVYGEILYPGEGIYVYDTTTVSLIAVNGAGVSSAVAKYKVSVQYKPNADIAITGPECITPGGSITLKATPVDAKTGIKWSVDNVSAEKGITITNKGVLKVPASVTDECTIVVIAAAASTPNVYNEYYVDLIGKTTSLHPSIEDVIPVKNIYQITNVTDVVQIQVKRQPDVASNAANHYRWSTSNAKIATVDENGLVTPHSAGKVTITVKAEGGKGVKGTITLEFRQPVEEISLYSDTLCGPEMYLKPGYSMQLVAEVWPEGAFNKKVTYSIDNTAKANGVTLTAAGKLTLPKGYAGPPVEVTATSQSNPAVTDSMMLFPLTGTEPGAFSFEVAPEAEQFVTYNKKGVPTAVTLSIYPEGEYPDYAQVATNFMGYGPVEFTSSNPDIVEVASSDYRYAYLVVNGNKPGKATITAKILDGTKRTVKLTVNTVPAVRYTDIPVMDLSPDGRLHLYKGTTHTLQFLAMDYSNKQVKDGFKWELLADYGPGITITEKGVLKIADTAQFEEGDRITARVVTTKSKQLDGMGNIATEWWLDIVLHEDKVTSIGLDTEFEDSNGRVYIDAKGKYAVRDIFTANISDSEYDIGGYDCTEDYTYLKPVAYSGSKKLDWLPPLTVSSSNTKTLAASAYAGYDSTVVDLWSAGKAGKSNVTIKTRDGKNISLKFPANVVVPVDALVDKTTQKSITKGGKLTFKVTGMGPYGETIAKPKLEWSVDPTSGRYGAMVSADGLLRVPSYYGNSSNDITVTARTTDGSGRSLTWTIPVVPKATYVNVNTTDQTGRAKYKNGNLSEVNLFTTELEYSDFDYTPSGTHSDIAEYSMTVKAMTDSTGEITWTASKEGIVDIYLYEGGKSAVLYGMKAGTTKITVDAADGSGKKVTFTVNVKTPVSDLSITTTHPVDAYMGAPVIIPGKSLKLKAECGDAYGKPNSTKVEWGIMDTELDGVTVKGGTVKVPKNYTDSVCEVKVYARTTDGSNKWAYYSFLVLPYTTTHISNGLNVKVYDSDGWPVYAVVNTKAGIEHYINPSSGEPIYEEKYLFISDSVIPFFTVTSSNPDIAAATSEFITMVTDSYGDPYFAVKGNKAYFIYSILIAGSNENRGSTNIKITAADGSNKSFSFKVTNK